jgi:hypothetical protein
MIHLTMRYGFPTYVEDGDSDKHPKNETLAEHKLHCKAKPDNCPFEKRAAKKAEEEDEVDDLNADEILTNNFYPDNSSVLPLKSIAGIKEALDVARPEIVKMMHDVFSSSKGKCNLKDFDLNGVRFDVFKDENGEWKETGNVVLSGIFSKGSEAYTRKINNKIREKFEGYGSPGDVLPAASWHSDHGGWLSVKTFLAYPIVRRIAAKVKGEKGSLKRIEAKKSLKARGYEIVDEDVYPNGDLVGCIPVIAKDPKTNTLHFVSIRGEQKDLSHFTEIYGTQYLDEYDHDFLDTVDDNIDKPEMSSQYLTHWNKVEKKARMVNNKSMVGRAKNILFVERVKHWLKKNAYKGDYCIDMMTVFGSAYKGKLFQTLFTIGSVFSRL